MFLKYSNAFIIGLMIFLFGCERAANVNDAENTLPPSVPTGLQVVSAHDGSVLIDWKANIAANTKGYFVYRGVNDSVSLKRFFFTSDSFFYDDSLSYDNTYYYKVSAVDDKDRESALSGYVRAVPENSNPPKPVRELEINARDWIDSMSVFLKWQPNNEGDIAGYQVYRSESSGFTPGKSNLLGTAQGPSFADKHVLKPYVTYYYKIITVDKGGLTSQPAKEISDLILGIPEVIFPANGSLIQDIDNFVIKSLPVPAHYKIVLQSNQYFGEFWSKEFDSNRINDTIQVKLDASYIASNNPYYWRIITFSNASNEPNSISPLYNFTIRP